MPAAASSCARGLLAAEAATPPVLEGPWGTPCRPAIPPGALMPPPNAAEADGGPDPNPPRPGRAGGRSKLSMPPPPSSVGEVSPPPALPPAPAPLAATPCGESGLLARAAGDAEGGAPKGEDGSRDGPPAPPGLDAAGPASHFAAAGPASHTPSPVPQIPARADGTLEAPPKASNPVPRPATLGAPVLLRSSAVRPLSFAARPVGVGSSSKPRSNRPTGREGRSSSVL